jgi:hypothetical protein
MTIWGGGARAQEQLGQGRRRGKADNTPDLNSGECLSVLVDAVLSKS